MSVFLEPGCLWCGVDIVGVLLQLHKPLLGAANPWVSEKEEVAVLVRSEVPGLEKCNKYNSKVKHTWGLINSSLSAPTKIEELTAGSDEKKHSAAPPGIEPRILRILVARSNHWATKPQRELRVNFRLSPSCQFFFHYEVTRIARVYKHAATNDNSLDLDPFNRKLALVGIIPNQLFSFSSDKFFFRLIRLSVLLSLSELKEKSWLGMIPTRASLRYLRAFFSCDDSYGMHK